MERAGLPLYLLAIQFENPASVVTLCNGERSFPRCTYYSSLRGKNTHALNYDDDGGAL